MSKINIFNKSDLDKFVKQIKSERKVLINSRAKFWKKNKKDFEKNVGFLIKSASTPKEWKIYTLASHFVGEKEIMPYGYDSWSIVLMIAATKKQGYELLLFFNEARIGFLSLPALVPLITHELAHTHQAARSPKLYNNGAFDDKYGSKLETEAEKNVHNLPKILVQEAVLESVLYCYDQQGWSSAEKMINFLYKDRVSLYTGGYLPWLTEEDYRSFLKAKKSKDINIFLNYYLSLI